MIQQVVESADECCRKILDCPRGARDGTPDLRNLSREFSLRPPPGRYFFHWFPFPHLIARPLEGMRARPQAELDNFIHMNSELPGPLSHFATPYHALLSLGVRPWFDRKDRIMRYFDKPAWLELEGPDASIEGRPGWRERILERQMTACAIISDWEKLPGQFPVRLASDFCLEVKDLESPYFELLEEDILCFHDEIACQMAAEGRLG